MLWIKSFHIIFVICWFAGLFYLPRLFVYHTEASDTISLERFKIMERRLYYGITWPSMLGSLLFGGWLFYYNAPYYLSAGWFHAKLTAVILLIIYHLYCGNCLKKFANNHNRHSSKFYRFYNEIPALLLPIVVILVVIKPF